MVEGETHLTMSETGILSTRLSRVVSWMMVPVKASSNGISTL